jgi:hypothetical protein
MSAKPVLPTGNRLRIGISSLVLFLACLAALAASMYMQFGFVVGLVISFFLFLAFFHAHYAFKVGLKRSTVKKIDYYYLSIAAIGALLTAVGYSSQRDVVIGHVSTEFYKAGSVSQTSQVRERIVAFKELACSEKAARLTDALCDRANKLSKDIGNDLTRTQVEELTGSFRTGFVRDIASVRKKIRDELGAERADQFTELYVQAAVEVLMSLSNLHDWKPDKKTQTASATDELNDLMYDFGRIFIGPFLLAWSLALRITKVTIELSEWAA